jgi:hypothetical protein
VGPRTGLDVRGRERNLLPVTGIRSAAGCGILLLLQSALQPVVGFGLLYDFVTQSSLFTLLSPVSHFHLLYFLFYLVKPSQSWSSYWSL